MTLMQPVVVLIALVVLVFIGIYVIPFAAQLIAKATDEFNKSLDQAEDYLDPRD